MSQNLLLKKIKGAALELTEVPLYGSPPPFPFETFSEALAKALETKGAKISSVKTEWLEEGALLEGMGKAPHIQPLTLSPLPGIYFLLLPHASKTSLFDLMLGQKGKGLSDPSLQDGFLTYIFLNACEAFNTLNPFGNLAAGLHEEAPMPEDGALAMDLNIQLGEASISARLLIPRDGRKSFQSHFSMESPPLFTDPRFSHLPMPLKVEIGSSNLTSSEWEKVQIGDFVLLDRCTFDIRASRGTATLTLGNTPLFDVRIKEGEAKILETAFPKDAQQVEAQPMTQEEEEEIPQEEATEGEEITLSGKVPMQITVEVGRIQMPLEKLTELKAGNVLELGLGPSPDVFLTVGGKRIAKGELVNLGDALGVKILKLGD